MNTFDERAPLATAMDLNASLNCPLSAAIDLVGAGQAQAGAPGGQVKVNSGFIYSPYDRWYNWGYAGEKTLRKLGDRFTWAGDSFSVLIGDRVNSFTDNTRWGFGSHPDNAGVWNPIKRQQEKFASTNDYPYTLSGWTGAARGLLDANYAMQDGAISRINGLRRYDNSSEGETDERVKRIPDFSNLAFPERQDLIPSQ